MRQFRSIGIGLFIVLAVVALALFIDRGQTPLPGSEQVQEQVQEQSQVPPDDQAQQEQQAQEDTEEQSYALFDVTDDMGAFTAFRYFPKGAHPLHEDSGVLYLTIEDLIKRYSFQLEELDTGTWAGGAIDFTIVAWLVRPMSLSSIYYMFSDKLVEAMAKNAAQVEKDFKFFGRDETRPLTTEEQAEFLRLSAAWTREAEACVSHIVEGTEAAPAVLTGPGDCAYLEEWGGLLLKAQDEPEKTLRSAASLLGKLAAKLDEKADSLAGQ